MPYVIPTSSVTQKLKKFNGIRRTRDGMLYITTIDRETVTDEYSVSKWFEDGKTGQIIDNATDEVNYVADRLESFNSQNFVGDGSTKTFTLNADMGYSADRLAVYVEGDLKAAYTDYTLAGTQLTMISAPATGKTVSAGQVNKRYFNNPSDIYQQFTFGTDANYLISTDGYFIKRENKTVSGLQSGADYDTYDESGLVGTSTWQSAV